MVKVPAMVMTGTPPEWDWNWRVFVGVVQVKLLKVVAPVIVEVPVVSKMTVPEEWVKVPELDQLPAMVKLLEAWAIKVVLADIVKLLFISSIEELVAAVTVTEVLVPLPRVRFPPIVNVPAPKV
jgi:hypothetical protein